MGAEAEATPPVEVSPEMEEQIDALLEIDDFVTLSLCNYLSAVSSPSLFYAALHMAAANGHHGIVEYLISKGVDLNASNEQNNTPLHWACLNGHIEVVKTLILAGANVSALNSHDQTPIDEALSKGKTDVFDAINAAVAQVELTQARVS
ncbi:Ankyrin repeat-containing protein P16F5.05c [Bienertia sinuspersici]